MTPTALRHFLLSPWKFHTLCTATALLACIPLLWPDMMERDVQEFVSVYAGGLLLAAFLLSLLLGVLVVSYFLLKLRNLRAIGQLAAWCGLWGAGLLLFMLMAILADAPPVREWEKPQPIQKTDTLFTPQELLSGPDSLVIPINPDASPSGQIVSIPYLTRLEKEHEELLHTYLAQAARWAHSGEDDTFYTRPGHVVLTPPATGSGIPGLVHATFRRLVEGDPLPKDYVLVRPGDPFPGTSDNREQIPDMALDLGRSHYLLLAWRGTAHRETAHKAINAAITAIDNRMQPLADAPRPETIARLVEGKINTTGKTPELRLCEPPSQYGAYQAEIYANPGESGTLLLAIKDLESGRTLRLLNCPAHHSDNPNELFRHDIPGSLPLWLRMDGFGSIMKLFPPGMPLFAIREGVPHQYFGAAFEVWFNPSDITHPRRMLLRRCYKVQAYEPPAPPEETIVPATAPDTPTLQQPPPSAKSAEGN